MYEMYAKAEDPETGEAFCTGWLPYDYVLSKLALDFWPLLKMEWVDTKKFGLK